MDEKEKQFRSENSLDNSPQAIDEGGHIEAVKKRHNLWPIWLALALLILGGLVVGILTFTKSVRNDSNKSNVNIQEVNLSGIEQVSSPLSTKDGDKVVINGQTQTNSLVINPSSTPTTTTTGQIYVDATTGQIQYYNGSSYVDLVIDNSSVCRNESSNCGFITLTEAQALIEGETNGVTSLQGREGDLTLAGTNGLSVSSIPGTVMLSLPQDLTTAGSPSFANLNLTSQPTNGVLVLNGSGTISSITTGTANQCLLSSVGAPLWGACANGTVTSVDGLSGAINILNASGSGANITIDDASTAQKGIAQFDSGDFNVTGGVVTLNAASGVSLLNSMSGAVTILSTDETNEIGITEGVGTITLDLPQNINTTSSPTFLAVNTNTITPTGGFTLGATTQSFTLQGSSASLITARSGGGFTQTLGFDAPTANRALTVSNETGKLCSSDLTTTSYIDTDPNYDICYDKYASSSGSGAYIQFAPASAQIDSSSDPDVSTIFVRKEGTAGDIIRIQGTGDSGTEDAFRLQANGDTYFKSLSQSNNAFRLLGSDGRAVLTLSTKPPTAIVPCTVDFEGGGCPINDISAFSTFDFAGYSVATTLTDSAINYTNPGTHGAQITSGTYDNNHKHGIYLPLNLPYFTDDNPTLGVATYTMQVQIYKPNSGGAPYFRGGFYRDTNNGLNGPASVGSEVNDKGFNTGWGSLCNRKAAKKNKWVTYRCTFSMTDNLFLNRDADGIFFFAAGQFNEEDGKSVIIDDLNIVQGTSTASYTNFMSISAPLQVSPEDFTSAFSVQDGSGGDILKVDSYNRTVSISVVRGDDGPLGASPTAAGLEVTADNGPVARFASSDSANGSPTVIIQAVSSQTKKLLSLQNSSGDEMTGFDQLGRLVFHETAGSAQTATFRFLGSNDLTADQIYYLPNASGTICVSGSYCGAGSGGNLQDSYDLSTGDPTPEIKLGLTQGSLDIQDADVTLAGSLLRVWGSGVDITTGNPLLNINSDGQFTLRNGVDSATAFQVQDFSGDAALSVNTTDLSVTVQGELIVNNGISSDGGAIVIQGNQLSTISATSGLFTTTLGFANPTADHIITIPDIGVGATDEFCLVTLSNCAGTGATTALDNLVAVAINTSLLPDTDDSIDLGDVTHAWNTAYLNNITPNSTLTVGDSAQTLTLQGNATTSLSATDSGFTSTLAFAIPTADHIYTLPDLLVGATDEICLVTLGNCAGSGTGITGSGTAGTVPIFTGAGDEIGDSATGTAFILQGSGASVITANNAGNTTTISFVTPTADVIYQFDTASAGTYDICTEANIVTCLSAAGDTSAAFLQGGNSFSTTAILGTNDNNSLAFETNNVTRLTLDTSGSFTIAGSVAGGTTHTLSVAAPTSGAGDGLTVKAGNATSGAGGVLTLQAGDAVGNSNAGGNVVISAGAPGSGGTAGAVNINGAAGNNAAGGGVTLTAGSAGSSGGGAVTLQGGSGFTVGGGNITVNGGAAALGGTVSITGGSSGVSVGGAISLTAGGGASTGGGITLQSGTGGITAGNINLTAANSGNNAGGSVLLTAGNATAGAFVGGAITLQAGTGGTSGTATGGTVNLQGGTGGTSSTGGSVNITGGAGNGNNPGGAVVITGGTAGGTAAATGGGITLQAANGSAAATGGVGGAIAINGGTGTGTGGRAGGAISVTAGSGGAHTGTSGVTAGAGAGITITMSTGGAASGATGNNIGGAGGAFSIQGGTGGAVASSTAFSTAVGGAGSSISLQAGTGGASTTASASTSSGGSGGGLTLNAGNGGNANNAAGGVGIGGSVSISAGSAGTGGGVNNSGGSVNISAGTSFLSSAGGGVTLQAGSGGSSGVGGSIGITAGSAGGGNTAGGSVSVTGGTATGTGTGGALTLQGGSGGSTAGSTAGAVTIQGGTGSSALTGGNGGSVSLIGSNATGDNTQSRNGGNVTIQAGNAQFLGAGGTLSITSGTAVTSGTVTIASGSGIGTGAVSLKSGNGSTIATGTLTLATGTTTTATSGILSVATGNASAGTSGALTVVSGTGTTGTGALSLGTGIASAGASGLVSVVSGNASSGTSGDVNISTGTGASATGQIKLETGIVSLINGSTTGSLVLLTGDNALNNVAHSSATGNIYLQSGNDNITTNGNVSTGSINIAVGRTNGSGTAGSINIGSNSGYTAGGAAFQAPSSINIGAIGTAATASTIHIADTTGDAAQVVTIGSTTNSGSTVTLQGGTGASAIQLIQGSGGTVTVGSNSGAAAVAVQCGTGTCGIGNNATDHSTTVGSTSGTSLLTLQSGSGGIALTSTTTITGNLLPNTAGSRDLGSASAEFDELYLGDTYGINFGLAQNSTLAYDITDTRLELTGNGTLFIEDRLSLGAQTLALTDDGTANDNLTPTASYVRIDIDETADGGIPDLTISEASAKDGDMLIIVNNEQDSSEDTFTISNSSGVVHLPGASTLTLGPNDSITLIYMNDRWITLSSSNN